MINANENVKTSDRLLAPLINLKRGTMTLHINPLYNKQLTNQQSKTQRLYLFSYMTKKNSKCLLLRSWKQLIF